MLVKWWSWVPVQWSSRCCHILNFGDEIFILLRFTVLRDMLIVILWVSYHDGRSKCFDVALHPSGSQRMWMGICVVMSLGAVSRQMSIIAVDTAVGAEVSIHTFGAIDVGMLTLLAFLICSEHCFSIQALFFVYIAVIHDGGFATGWRGALILQNCPLACWHTLNCCSKILTAFVSSYVMPKYLLFMLQHAENFL